MSSMSSMSSISPWWLALTLLALPIWWHRQRRQRVREQPLATARFLPQASPLQLRVWRWSDPLLLLLRCLLLTAVVAWLADLVLPWRGDSVLAPAGADSAWVERQARQAGFADAAWLALPQGDAFAWLAQHEREWRAGARLLIVGDVPMPALLPRARHQVQVIAKGAPGARRDVVVTVFSKRAPRWKALFDAANEQGQRRYLVTEGADARAELVVWDLAEAPPAGLRAPLWWIADATAFPDLRKAPMVDGIHVAASARGRLWLSDAWPPDDAAAARSLLNNWQRLHYAPQPYTLASQTLAAGADAPQGRASGALHYILTMVLIALFALERMMAHARRR